MSKAKTLQSKLFYLIFALTLIAGMIPLAAAAPVSAAGTITPSEAWNVVGAPDVFILSGNVSDHWGVFPPGFATLSSPNGTGVTVQAGTVGEATIVAYTSDNQIIASANKRWGTFTTNISAPQSTAVSWNGTGYSANLTVTDQVYGNFWDPLHQHLADGATLSWFLVKYGQMVPMTPQLFGVDPTLLTPISSLTRAQFARFSNGLTSIVTTNTPGSSSQIIFASGEEAVQVVVVPQYPIAWTSGYTTPEVTTVSFWTQQMEKVPQVRWAGEKIVLEKYFGNNDTYNGRWTTFSLENQSPGALEAFGSPPLNLYNDSQRVWSRITNGWASCILVSEDPGECDVDLALYKQDNVTVEAQVGFVVFYLKFEDLTLGNVQGKRAGHNSGIWTPGNPWNSATDNLTGILNVSQDDLLRATVRGWFKAANDSVRDYRDVDTTGDNITDVRLPAGRWILPDDWPILGGGSGWQFGRLHWDIMNSPNEPAGYTVYGYPSGLGDYWAPTPSITKVASANVTGPFSPGLEIMTSSGWNPDLQNFDPRRNVKTVVPNKMLDKWDCPMPPAKILFLIKSGNGFFKSADKDDIYYYIKVGTSSNTTWYTNPFYKQMIPAHEAIPAFPGYDWDTFGTSGTAYGPYEFWTIINRPEQPNNPFHVATSDPANHPTMVEVYNDNHGEAMVYLNGDWNLAIDGLSDGGHDVITGSVVGTNVVQAMADYPYLRKHTTIFSNTVTKTWTWGLQILGANPNTYPGGAQDPSTTRMVIQTGTLTGLTGTPPWETAFSPKKMMWIWITDRDNQRGGAENVSIDFYIDPLTPAMIAATGPTATGVSNYNWITGNITLTDGMLTNPDPDRQGFVDMPARTHAMVYTRAPNIYEIALFEKFFPHSGLMGLDSSKFAVAGIEIFSSGSLPVHVSSWIHMPREGLIIRNTNMDFGVADLADDQLAPGDANMDGSVNMGDVVCVERIILGLALKSATADANQNYSVDMGDVVRIERNILGLK